MLITNYSPAGVVNNSANKTKTLLQNTPSFLGNYQATQLKQDTFTPNLTKQRAGITTEEYEASLEKKLTAFLATPHSKLEPEHLFGF